MKKKINVVIFILEIRSSRKIKEKGPILFQLTLEGSTASFNRNNKEKALRTAKLESRWKVRGTEVVGSGFEFSHRRDRTKRGPHLQKKKKKE